MCRVYESVDVWSVCVCVHMYMRVHVCLCRGGVIRGGGGKEIDASWSSTYVSRTGRGGGDSENLVVNAITKFSPVCDKIFILRAGTVMTLHMVLVWLTGILSEYAYALMIAKNIELKFHQPV